MEFMVFSVASYMYAGVRLGNMKEIIIFFFLKEFLKSFSNIYKFS